MKRKSYKFQWDDESGTFKEPDSFDKCDNPGLKKAINNTLAHIVAQAQLKRPNVWLYLTFATTLILACFVAAFILILKRCDGWGIVFLVAAPILGLLFMWIHTTKASRIDRANAWIESNRSLFQQSVELTRLEIEGHFYQGKTQ